MARVRGVRLGRLGEDMAASHLEREGWTIVARNVRAGRREVDLVARRGRVLAFVEVKTRRGGAFGHPLESITVRKQGEIRKVAGEWMRKNRIPAGTLFRFDAVAVHWREDGPPRVVHVPDAWRRD